MKIVSWNVRGLGDSQKRSFVRKDLGSFSTDWVALKETKLQSVNSHLVHQICGQRDWGFPLSTSLVLQEVFCVVKTKMSFLCQNVWWIRDLLPLRVNGLD